MAVREINERPFSAAEPKPTRCVSWQTCSERAPSGIVLRRDIEIHDAGPGEVELSQRDGATPEVTYEDYRIRVKHNSGMTLRIRCVRQGCEYNREHDTYNGENPQRLRGGRSYRKDFHAITTCDSPQRRATAGGQQRRETTLLRCVRLLGLILSVPCQRANDRALSLRRARLALANQLSKRIAHRGEVVQFLVDELQLA